MKKIVILGCENSHADAFLKCIAEKEEFSHIEVVGVYSDDPEAAQKLHDQFGAPIMASYDEAVGKVDGVVITARHGDNHYKYAKPYIASGVPFFIDKPITCTEAEAAEFMAALKENGVKVTGGSSLRHAHVVQSLRAAEKLQIGGKAVGGMFRAPLSIDNPYGGFFFYSQHLIEMVLEVFGRFPKSVQVTDRTNDTMTVQLHYEGFSVTGLYTIGNGEYFAARLAFTDSQGGFVRPQGPEWYYGEFKAFVDLVDGGEMDLSYEELFAAVYILNAIHRSMESGKIETINY